MFLTVVVKPARFHVVSYVSLFPIDSGFVCDSPVNSRVVGASFIWKVGVYSSMMDTSLMDEFECIFARAFFVSSLICLLLIFS